MFRRSRSPSSLGALALPLGLAAWIAAAGPAAAQNCRDAMAWITALPASTTCGCTVQEAQEIAKSDARASCAAAANAVNCTPLVCDPNSHTRCETVVVRAPRVGTCSAVPAGTLGCPSCPGGTAVQCQVPAQQLTCDCACQPGRCNEASWAVSRAVSFCTENNEEARRQNARAAFLAECMNAPHAQSCAGRECPPVKPMCNLTAHGSFNIVQCQQDPLCPPGEVRCEATGSVRCACECQ